MTVCTKCLKHYKTIWKSKSPDSPSQGVDCATRFYDHDKLIAGYGSSFDYDRFKSYDKDLNAMANEVVLCDSCVMNLLELGKLTVLYDDNYGYGPSYPLSYYDKNLITGKIEWY